MNIPLDEYIHRCEAQMKAWEFVKDKLEDHDAPNGVLSRSLVLPA